jgi:hypothetical protein
MVSDRPKGNIATEKAGPGPYRIYAPQWQEDNQPLGRADRKLIWLPQPGQHHLTLTDAKGKEIDAV